MPLIAESEATQSREIMEKKQEQREREAEKEQKGKYEGLPMEDSPYLQYKDLEDYKQQGYGTQGHLQPKPGRAGASTDAPTLSGGSVNSQAQVPAADAISRIGIP